MLHQLRALIEDPPPAFAFEVSPAGIAFAIRPARKGHAPEIRWHPFSDEVLAVSPVKDNVLLPDLFQSAAASLVPSNGRRRDAALILPDYAVRIVVLDFESFPKDKAEQLSLVRFRMKKTVPFDLDSAAVSFQVREINRKFEVLVAAAQVEVVARYEAPFRAAGFQPGLATTSILAAMDLMPAQGLHVAVKLGGRSLTVAVCDGRHPKLVRCVELDSLTIEEVMAVLFPTLAYAEDEMPERPRTLFACGFGEAAAALDQRCRAELGLAVEPLRSQWGPANEHNAGLLGWLHAQEGRP